jgi:hypothetical protein
MVYLVGYQLRCRASSDDYERLDAALRLLGGRRILNDQWAVRCDFSQKRLAVYLQSMLHPEDRMIVSEVVSPVSGSNLPWEFEALQPDWLQHR